MPQEQVTVEAVVQAPIAETWHAYTAPDHVTQWNFASDDWCCPRASADLREGGTFSARMEAKDGSMGFDFEGTYTKIIPHARIDYVFFGGRQARVDFVPQAGGVLVRITFDPESEFPVDQQREGWQAILNNFARHAGKA